MTSLQVDWNNAGKVPTKSFRCSYCGELISSNLGFNGAGADASHIYICHVCKRPTFFERGNDQYPGVFYGGDVSLIPNNEVENLYREARACIAIKAYTASILCSRKLLMNIAVSLGAAEGKKFIEYIEYLSASGYIPPNGRGWVDHIRKKGNEATHEIKLASEDDAKQLIDFLYMLMKFIYEFPGLIPSEHDDT